MWTPNLRHWGDSGTGIREGIRGQKGIRGQGITTIGVIRGYSVCPLYSVRAGLVERAEDWPWSSVRAHLAGRDDELVTVQPALDQLPNFPELLKTECGDAIHNLKRSERTGRPAGAEEFVLGLERLLRRPIARRSPGRKPASVIIEKQLSLLQ